VSDPLDPMPASDAPIADPLVPATPAPAPIEPVAASSGPPVGVAAPRRGGRPEWWLAIVLIVADQLSKSAIRTTIPLYESVEVIPGLLNLTHVLNTGAAFGVLNGLDFAYKSILVSLLATAALAAIVFYAMTLGSESRMSRLALTLVVAGAIGNLIDRFVSGAVVDFVDVYWGTWHFWAFNVADSCISIGAVLLILDMFRTGSHVPSPA
jgi:signal peptidase II